MRKCFLFFLFIGFFRSYGDDVSLQAAKLYQKVQKKFSDVPVKSFENYKHKKNELVLVDVRSLKERKVSVIPGAMSKESFEAEIEKFKNKDIVVYCTIGHRSAKYVRALRKRKIAAYNLEGSLLGWIHQGGEIVNFYGKKTKKVHVYGRKWNLLPKEFQGIW